jgi:hypothetical protein
MAKTVPNKPQQLGDSQWLLTWQGTVRTDVITAVLGGQEMRVSPFDQSSPMAIFSKPDFQSGGLLLDLSLAPESSAAIEFTFDVMVDGERAWTIEGLSTGEVWQNESVKVPADAPCLVLSLERNEGGWQVVAREEILGEHGDITVDDQIPEAYRELVSRATAKGIASGSMNILALLDVTPAMNQAHENGSVEKILNCLVAVGASANNRPIDVSFHGVFDRKLSVDDEISSSYQQAFEESIKSVQNAKPLHSLIPQLVDQLKPKSTLYVITDSMFFVEEEIIDDLAKVDSKIRVLLTGSEALRFNLPANAQLQIIQVGSLIDSDSRATMGVLA